MRVQEVVMSNWPVVDDETPTPFQQTEQEASWLAPQCMCPLSGETERENARPEDQQRPVTLGFIAWVRSVSVFHRHR
jgi:hypothetical protein